MLRPSDDPFLRLDSVRYDDIVADGLVHLLRDAGLDAVSMAALARWMKATPAAVAERARRPETIQLMARAMGRRWLAWSRGSLAVLDLPAVPRTEEERHGVRVWLLLGELARSEASMGRTTAAEVLDEASAVERELVEQWWDRACGPRVAAASGFEDYWVLVSSLRAGLALDPGLSVASAEGLLAEHAPAGAQRRYGRRA